MAKTYPVTVNCVAALTVVVFISGMYLGNYIYKRQIWAFINQIKVEHAAPNQFMYTSPLYGINLPEATELGLLTDLKKKIQKRIDEAKQGGTEVEDVSFYYRNLDSLLWTLLQKKFVYTKELSDMNKARQNAAPSELPIGSSYTLRSAAAIMLKDSDNGARDLVAAHIPDVAVNDAYMMIGTTSPRFVQGNYEISVTMFSRFLRMLYGASYLNAQDSNEVLKLLNESGSFDDGIKKYMPEGINVAHKWGVVNLPVDEHGGMLQELHDCGIIYTEHAFVVCVMTRGHDFNQMASVIADLAKISYDYTKDLEKIK